MFFDTHMWGTALGWSIGTAIVMAIIAFLASSGSDNRKKSTPAGVAQLTFFATFIVNLLLMRVTLYYGQPAMIGSFGGYWLYLAYVAVCAVITWVAIGGTGGRQGLIGSLTVILGLLLIGVPIIQSAADSWGTANKRSFAKRANIRTAKEDEQLPPTDQNHIIMVTQEYAAYTGSAHINSPENHNLGTVWKTEESDYTLQSVNGHLYWIAPLVYTNFWSQVGILGTQFSDSPGFVAVDAEDPNAPAKVHLSDPKGNQYHIRYFPDAYFMQNLLRYVYLNGYTNGKLEDPTLEVTDDWQPYYTVSYILPAVGIVGQKLDKVLLVNAQTGQIQEFDPAHTPDWVDRVMSEDLVKEYAQDWGSWQDANSTWPNWNSQYQMEPLELEFHYNSVDKPVWVVPMVNSCSNCNKNSAAGILVYDTHDNQGVFYPGLSGKAVGDKVRTNFHDTTKNNNGRLTTASVQLYAIFGVPTWVAIYQNSSGQYGGIGMLDAREPNVANVQLEGTKDAVVRSYKNYLVGMNANSGNISGSGNPGITVEGHIARISPALVLNNTATFFFTIKEDTKHSFTVTLDKNGDLPLIESGDAVTIQYLDTGDHQAGVSKLTIAGPSTK